MNESERMNNDRKKKKRVESNDFTSWSPEYSQIHMHKRSHQKPKAIANDAQRPTILDHVNYAFILNDVCMLDAGASECIPLYRSTYTF